MSALRTIAAFGLQEALRRRVCVVVALLTVAFLALYGLGTWQAFEAVRADPFGSPIEGVEVETAAGLRVIPRAGRADVPAIVRDLVAAGEEVYGVRVRRSTLEDAYLEAVGAAA